MITLVIDGQEIETAPGRTVLEVAREHGIHIPTLCYHEAMEPFAACRLCVVEVETGRVRRLVASCAYPCSDSLVVHTHSDRAWSWSKGMPAAARERTVTVVPSWSGETPVTLPP